MISVLLVRLPRIPIAVEKVAQAPALNIRETVMNIFPYSPLETLLNGASLLPAFVFACLTGAACVAEKAKSKPVMTLIESLSDVFYACLSFIMDIMSIGMIAIACSWAINYFPVIQSGELTPLVIMFSVDFLIIACVIYPLLLFLLCCEKHPYKILYAALAPVIAAFFSGDTNYAFPFQIRHGMESLGIKRRVSGFVFPLFSAFARGGSAMVLTISFIVILRTYSPIGISVSDILWVTGVAFGLSFLLNAQSTGGAYTALAVLCAVYGSGFEAV
jgi:Na+/H+-dicarboxylate symporter